MRVSPWRVSNIVTWSVILGKLATRFVVGPEVMKHIKTRKYKIRFAPDEKRCGSIAYWYNKNAFTRRQMILSIKLWRELWFMLLVIKLPLLFPLAVDCLFHHGTVLKSRTSQECVTRAPAGIGIYFGFNGAVFCSYMLCKYNVLLCIP